MKYFINDLIPYLVVAAQVFLVTVIILHKHKQVKPWLKQHAMQIIFAASLSAMLGSLFYSLIMGYPPCELCWYQRILMYPIAFISFFSLKKHTKEIKRIILTLASIGILFSGYQYLSQITDTTTFCGIGATNCSDKIIFLLGYLSIPLMAFTAFAIIIFAATRIKK